MKVQAKLYNGPFCLQKYKKDRTQKTVGLLISKLPERVGTALFIVLSVLACMQPLEPLKGPRPTDNGTLPERRVSLALARIGKEATR